MAYAFFLGGSPYKLSDAAITMVKQF